MLFRIDVAPNILAYTLLSISLLAILGFVIFILNWGDRIQLVSTKIIRLIFSFSLLSGYLFYIIVFIFVMWIDSVSVFLGIPIDLENFTRSDGKGGGNTWSIFLIIALFISAITVLVLKQFSYRTIKLHQLQGKEQVIQKNSEILRAENLKIYYPIYGGLLKRVIGYVKAVNGISFSIKAGETLGLVGESGCGKSTVANTILGLVPIKEGKIFFDGKVLPEIFPNEIRQQIQIVFQDPDASLNPRMKIVDIVAEPLRNLVGITNKNELREIVFQLLQKVSLKREHLDRYPHEFSGGQKQRIIIARALACEPKLIILDEPTSALDVSVQAQILNLLHDLQKDYEYGFLFITHNLSVVNHIANNVAVMYLGRFVEYGSTDEIFNTPVHPYTKALLSARSDIDFDHKIERILLEGEVPSPINPPSGCAFNPRCMVENKDEKCFSVPPKGYRYAENHIVWCHQLEGKYKYVEDEPTLQKKK
ncbi:MAG: ABC transporter ATP-binding protein [Promethearchaeota archaeon]